MKVLILLLILTVSCKSIRDERDDILILQKNINDCDIEILNESILLMSRSYQIQPAIRVKYNKIIYFVNVNSSNKIIYASTSDKNFITPDSVKVGDTFDKIYWKLTYYTRDYDNFTYSLKSGWKAIIKYDGSNDQKIPADSSRVVWFEKFEE